MTTRGYSLYCFITLRVRIRYLPITAIFNFSITTNVVENFLMPRDDALLYSVGLYRWWTSLALASSTFLKCDPKNTTKREYIAYECFKHMCYTICKTMLCMKWCYTHFWNIFINLININKSNTISNQTKRLRYEQYAQGKQKYPLSFYI